MIYDFTHVYLKSWWYDLQFLRIRVWQTKIGNYGSVFALLTPAPHPAKNPKNQNFQKNEKIARDIILHMCVTKTTIIWGTVSETEWQIDRQIFLSVWAIFCPFTPLKQPSKSKFWKKKPRDIISLHLCTANDNHMMYGSWDMECDRLNFFSL